MDELGFPYQSGMDYVAFIQAGGHSGCNSGVPNRYIVDGNLRQQKIKDIIKTWTGPKMVIIERHRQRVLCPKP